MNKQIRTAEFVTKARDVHGDRYDYGRTIYRSAYENVTIVCPDHGPFQQAPANHARGSGCPACASAKLSALRTKSTDQFIAEARAVHGKRYSYASTIYTGNKDKLIIVCPDHGPFEQIPSHHLNGSGCQRCGRDSMAASRRLTTADFIAKARKVHGLRYDYSLTTYTYSKNKVVIVCPDHGPFEQVAGSHLSGHGCQWCWRKDEDRL